MTAICISFTGRGMALNEGQKTIVAEAIRRVQRRTPNVALFYSGAQKGVDVWAAECAIRYFPQARHVVVVPRWSPEANGAPHPCHYSERGVRRLRQVANDQGAVLGVTEGPVGFPKPANGYLRRDDVLAQNCTHLMAFPEHAEEIRRSGTWATVRRALKQGRPVLVTPLDGSKPYKRAS